MTFLENLHFVLFHANILDLTDPGAFYEYFGKIEKLPNGTFEPAHEI